MAIKVFYSSLDNSNYETPLNKIKRLLEHCNIYKIFNKKELIGIKVHFGELGNTSYLRPIFLRPIIELLKKMETKPYLTDTNTLYTGMRSNSVDHLYNATLNGFNYSTLQTPIIIADGLRGENTKEIKIKSEVLKKVKIASDIFNADGMIVISHFKGHEISGFGGTIKNLSMGCASRQGKLDMHSQNKPVVKQSKCTACGKCINSCQVKAIIIKDKATITDKCVGCTRCVSICPEEAINILWNASSEVTQKKMIDYAFTVTEKFKPKILFINVLISMSPACDCYGGNDKPVTEDIGFLASTDPIALDKASFDMVKKQYGNDPFKDIYPQINSNIQFEYARKIGFSKLNYEIIKID